MKPYVQRKRPGKDTTAVTSSGSVRGAPSGVLVVRIFCVCSSSSEVEGVNPDRGLAGGEISRLMMPAPSPAMARAAEHPILRSRSDRGGEPGVVSDQIFLDVMRLVQHTFRDSHKRAGIQRNVTVSFDPNLCFPLQDVQNVVGFFVDVARNFRPNLPMDDGACHVHMFVLLGEQISNLYAGELRMRSPIHFGWLDDLRLNGLKHVWT